MSRGGGGGIEPVGGGRDEVEERSARPRSPGLRWWFRTPAPRFSSLDDPAPGACGNNVGCGSGERKDCPVNISGEDGTLRQE